MVTIPKPVATVGFMPMPAVEHIPNPVAVAIRQSAALPTTQELLVVLKDSVNPFQREWAAMCLAGVNWQGNAEVVPALVRSARTDAAPAVRVQCIRCLAKRNVQTMPVLAVIRELKTDVDPRVRNEAAEALIHFTSPHAAAPASSSMPNSTVYFGRAN